MRVNKGTKKAQELIHDMFRFYYKGKTLYECYGTCSRAKIEAWENIENDCRRLGGEGLHITGAGSHFFSCIYAYPVTDDETGELKQMVIRKETAGNTYELYLTPEEYEEASKHGII